MFFCNFVFTNPYISTGLILFSKYFRNKQKMIWTFFVKIKRNKGIRRKDKNKFNNFIVRLVGILFYVTFTATYLNISLPQETKALWLILTGQKTSRNKTYSFQNNCSRRVSKGFSFLPCLPITVTQKYYL